ncbi:hypothetical protein EHO57_14145 [Leptospira langatensis]|uniref:Uncharacterized protein n=1 Tax=Leptospira langatensis TaxID=2484983 RepID=A0A5R2ASY0_9LEPT|nr:hypothetical protein [Leptospira langatensis]TGJ99895.1 hypothetical protein EHO57_14145 [Leptospira langatensis]
MSQLVPAQGETYYFVTSDGSILDVPWNGDETDYDRLGFGNVFRRKGNAVAARDEMKGLFRKYRKVNSNGFQTNNRKSQGSRNSRE